MFLQVTSETQLQVKESGSMVPKVRKEGLEHLELEAVEVGTDQQESMLQELKGLAAYLDSMEFKVNANLNFSTEPRLPFSQS